MEEVRDDVLALPDVTGIGVGVREIEGEEVEEAAVCVYVAEGAETPAGLPEKLGEVPVQVEPLSVVPTAGEDTRRYPEMKGGIRIYHPETGRFGTFGAVVKASADIEGEELYFGLTAEHVVGAPVGKPFPEVVWQSEAPPLPTAASPRDDAVGSVFAFEKPEPIPLAGGAIVGDMDAALFELDIAAAQGRYPSAAIVDGSGEGEMVPAVTATGQPLLCGMVRKRGFVTGYTEGKVRGIHCHFAWDPAGPNRYLVEQFLIQTTTANPGLIFATDGDSGSLVLERDSATAVGLLWGKDLRGLRAMASKIWKIEEAFGVTAVL